MREQPTMICYFASPFTDLAMCGVYKDGTDHYLTSANIRNTISQFLYEMQSQVQELARIAGCICFGTRIIRTGPNTGFAFYKDPNQYIFNLGWVNVTTHFRSEYFGRFHVQNCAAPGIGAACIS